jgi:UDP-2,3-diacylglucosamine pyrophosphatase LpxH
MSKKYYRSVWISDTHLCSRDCRVEYLLSFLKSVKCEYLYLVGDFIDIWQMKRRWYWPQSINNVVHKVLAKSKKGAKVTYIPGNHDEFFRAFVGHQFGGVQIKDKAIHTTADGRRMLILHGDEFDMVVQYNKWLAVIGSAAYDYLVTVNRVLNLGRRKLNMPYWSLSAAIKRKVKNAVTYVGKYEAAMVREARKESVDGIICGHIHQPAIKMIDGYLYCNTGDWVENCTALVEEEDGKLSIVHWLSEWEREIGAVNSTPDAVSEPEFEEELVPMTVRWAI